jgi:DNA-binding NtrC family response regulator
VKILVIDDEKEFAEGLAKALGAEGHAVRLALTGAEGLLKVRQEAPEAVLLDVNMPDITGLDLLPELLRTVPGLAVVMITGQASHRSAVAAMKMGAEDYLEKPFAWDELGVLLKRIAEKHGLQREIADLRQRRLEDYAKEHLFLDSPAMRQAYADIEKVGSKDQVAVLVEGETGTGKEHAAHLLHLQSPRGTGPFVGLHCAALPETLLESELFGYEAGAFTGALKQKKGLFEMASGGTLFLDEVGELPLSTQTKLLKVLEDRVLRRLGGLSDIKLDVRLVSATNRDLESEVAAGRFRADLFYRLNVFRVRLPPLRGRNEDIAALARHFFASACERFDRDLGPLDDACIEALTRHKWPGNVRELRNFMDRMAIHATGTALTAAEINAHLPAAPSSPAPGLSKVSLSRERLEEALRSSGGDKTRAAAALGVSRPTLYRHLKTNGMAEWL